MLTSATAAYDNVTRTAKKSRHRTGEEAGVEAAANSAKTASAAVAHRRRRQSNSNGTR